MTRIRERLENWALCYRDIARQGKSLTGIICEDLERHSGQTRGLESKAPAERDEADAAIVEQGMRKIICPSRDLLVWLYAHRSKPAFICRRLHIAQKPETIFDMARYHAESQLERAIDFSANRVIIPSRLPIRQTPSAATQGTTAAERNDEVVD